MADLTPDPQQQEASAQSVQTDATSEFDRLLQKAFKPKTERAKDAVESAVRTLAEQALLDTQLVSDDVLATIESLIAKIDEKLSTQINVILHSEQFQKVESAWRGLHYLVTNTESDESLIRLQAQQGRTAVQARVV